MFIIQNECMHNCTEQPFEIYMFKFEYQKLVKLKDNMYEIRCCKCLCLLGFLSQSLFAVYVGLIIRPPVMIYHMTFCKAWLRNYVG